MAAKMSLEQRVIDVVSKWGYPIPFPLKKSSSIKDVWGQRGDTVPFPDPATRILIQELQDEFRAGDDARVLTKLTPAVFDAGGLITTLKDLITYVDDAPPLQHVVISGFASEAVKQEFASAVADALHEKLFASNKTTAKVQRPPAGARASKKPGDPKRRGRRT